MSHLVELMKTGETKGMLFIRPSLEVARLVFRNGLMALRCCLEIV